MWTPPGGRTRKCLNPVRQLPLRSSCPGPCRGPLRGQRAHKRTGNGLPSPRWGNSGSVAAPSAKTDCRPQRGMKLPSMLPSIAMEPSSRSQSATLRGLRRSAHGSRAERVEETRRDGEIHGAEEVRHGLLKVASGTREGPLTVLVLPQTGLIGVSLWSLTGT